MQHIKMTNGFGSKLSTDTGTRNKTTATATAGIRTPWTYRAVLTLTLISRQVLEAKRDLVADSSSQPRVLLSQLTPQSRYTSQQTGSFHWSSLGHIGDGIAMNSQISQVYLFNSVIFIQFVKNSCLYGCWGGLWGGRGGELGLHINLFVSVPQGPVFYILFLLFYDRLFLRNCFALS